MENSTKLSRAPLTAASLATWWCAGVYAGTVRIVPRIDTFTAHANDAELGNSDLTLSTTNASLQKAIRHLDALAYETGDGGRGVHIATDLTLHRQTDRKGCDLTYALNILFIIQFSWA